MQKTKNAMLSAKAALKGKWHHAILVFCIVAAALGVKMLFVSITTLVFSKSVSSFDSTLISTVITLVATALELFCFCPLYVGALKWLWQTICGADEPLDTLLYYYETKSDYIKGIEIGFNFLWRIYGYFLVCGLPFSAVTWARQLMMTSSMFGESVQTATHFFWIALGVAGGVLFIVLVARHFLVLPIIFTDDNIDVFDAFRVANVIAKGRFSYTLSLMIRFLPLALICVVALPIIWVVPYFAASLFVLSRFLITDYKSAVISVQNSPQNEQ